MNGKIVFGTESVVSTFLPLSNQTVQEFEMTIANLPQRAKTCSVPQCDSPTRIRKGYCVKHYAKFREYGDPLATSGRFAEGPTIADRFWNRVDKTSNSNGCWEWTWGLAKSGYGQLTVDKKVYTAHRYAWFLTYGTLPQKHILHSCDNRKCVNPSHLSEGTNYENVQDMVAKGRNAHGEVSYAKLTEADVIEIRSSIEPAKVLAKRKGVAYGTIRDVVNRKTWRHIP